MSYRAIPFTGVLPSAIGLMLIGLTISVFYQPWSWTGALGMQAIPLGVVFGALLYLFMFCLSVSRFMRIESIHSLSLMLHQLFKHFTWTHIIIISVLAGIGEEVLIRGALQSFLVSSSSPLIGIIVTSFIFGLLHCVTKIYVLVTFLLGLVFAVVFYITDSMILVMLGHVVYDIFAFSMIVKFPHKLGLVLPEKAITTID